MEGDRLKGNEKENEKDAKMWVRVTEITADRSLFNHPPPPSASPNLPYTGRRQKEPGRQTNGQNHL